MANPNSNPIPSDDSNVAASTGAVSSSMARLNALKRLSQLKTPFTSRAQSTTQTGSAFLINEDEGFFDTTPQPLSPTPLPIADPSVAHPNTEEEVDWEALFAASTQPNVSVPVPIASVPEQSLASTINLHQIDNNLDFLPPTIAEDNEQKVFGEKISQSLRDISTPILDDSSDFFSPPFSATSSHSPAPISPTSIQFVDQIQLKPDIITPDAQTNKLEVIHSEDSFPLTLLEDPAKPNPITQMLKQLQSQFGNQIKQAMINARARLKDTTAQFNNKGGDASNLEALLFKK